MTTAEVTPVEAIAAPARLDAYRTAALQPDAPLDSYLCYVRELCRADEGTLAGEVENRNVQLVCALGRLQGTLEHLAEKVTREFSADVRAAPPSGLAEVLAEVASACGNERCGERVLPWEGDYCSDPCETADQRTRS